MTAFHFSRATLAVALTAACLATACGPAASGVPVLEVERQSTEFIVAAEGEVIASEALPIALPSDIRMEFNVVWMAPEFSEVKKGDVIARFDDVQIQLDREDSALNVAKSEFKLAGTERADRASGLWSTTRYPAYGASTIRRPQPSTPTSTGGPPASGRLQARKRVTNPQE